MVVVAAIILIALIERMIELFTFFDGFGGTVGPATFN